MKLATLCYVKRDGKTLMLHRTKKENDIHEGKWNGLGGKFEQGESPEECAIRELREESGLVVRNPKLAGVLTFPKFARGEDWYVFVFIVTDFSGELIDSPEGDLEWIDDGEIMNLNLWEGDSLFIQWMLEGKFFSGKFEYADGRLASHEATFHAIGRARI